jgi:NAD(P)-dependent dehydrogenase (short-subunit alcohol dehydrogenase family)
LTRSFEGRIAVVTGASRGIGRAIALNLALEGATVCVVGRNPATLDVLEAGAAPIKEWLVPCRADLEQDPDIISLASSLTKAFNGVDILVHCAGCFAFGNMSEARIEDFDRQYRVNVRAPYLLTQALLPALRARQGQVVFVNSSAGVLARAGAAGYSASKHALKAVADALREEVKHEGLRIISIYPGRTATRMQEQVSQAEGTPYIPETLMQPEDVAKVVLEALRLDRNAEITDITLRPALKYG